MDSMLIHYIAQYVSVLREEERVAEEHFPELAETVISILEMGIVMMLTTI